MITKFVSLFAALPLLGAGILVAQEDIAATKAAEGTLTIEKKNYPLKHALAYETTINDEELIAVVLSGQRTSSEKLKAAMAAEKEGDESEFNRPFLKLEFTKAGQLKVWSAGAGNTSLGRRGGNATGELTIQDGRVTGKASQPLETEGMFPSGFDVRFDAALVKAGESLPASAAKKPGPAANVKPTVTGSFKGNGKEANLAYVSAHWREPFNDKPGMVLVFTEKDHSKDKKPDFNAAFGKFGSALIISLHEDGGIFGCQVVHTAHKQQGFTSLGQIQTSDFEYADGKVSGGLATDGELDVFGEKWQADLKFVAPLGEIPAEFQPKAAKQSAKATKPADDDDDDDDNDADEVATAQTTSKAGSGLKAKELALTKDAADVVYKALVGQIAFTSKTPVKAACAELATSLKAQGWTSDGPDMVNPNSSILKRKHGGASVTIFVKPNAGGSEVKMMTEGLDWDGM